MCAPRANVTIAGCRRMAWGHKYCTPVQKKVSTFRVSQKKVLCRPQQYLSIWERCRDRARDKEAVREGGREGERERSKVYTLRGCYICIPCQIFDGVRSTAEPKKQRDCHGTVIIDEMCVVCNRQDFKTPRFVRAAPTKVSVRRALQHSCGVTGGASG